MHAANTSKRLDNYFVLKSYEQEKLVQAAELTMCYHTDKHHMSFSSLDGTIKLSQKNFNDSKTAKNVSLGRTKATAVVKSTLAPDTSKQICEDLESIHYFGIATDASNHGSEKIFPLIVQYLTVKNGITVKVLKLDSLKN